MEIIQSPTVPRLQQNLWLDSTNNTLNAPTKDGWQSITSGASGGGITETTYEELVGLRDAGELVPGTLYRITDYITTTSQTNTGSAEHQFDIIVLALSENSLSEDAKAALHEGDTYFSECNLDAWKIKYCIDNDTTRFAWADDTNGRGVIYYMRDEGDNECPYDFKNIQLKQNVNDDPAGIIADTFYYTFSYINGSNISDLSLTKNCLSNKIGESHINNSPYNKTDKLFIPNNIIVTNYYGSGFTIDCNVFKEDCTNNAIFRGYNNTFDSLCTGNRLGDGCKNNYFGLSCADNKLGNGCDSNVFFSGSGYNTLGQSCFRNYFFHGTWCSFGNSCSNNVIFNGSEIHMGSSCNHNMFEPDCSYIIFGTNASSPSPRFEYITVESGNQYIKLQRAQDNGVYRYITISKAVRPESSSLTYKTITLGSATGTNYKTTYKTANDVEIDV